MSEEPLEYVGTHYIKRDLRRLKKWPSLEQDIINHYKMIMGKLTDDLLSSVFNFPFGDFVTEVKIEEEIIHFYKVYIAISSPRLSSRNGARLIYGIIRKNKKFVPILVFGAFEEGKYYPINGKKLPLQKNGLVKIIDEKLKSI